ncbi:glycosyltransferase family 4 protein [bacterium]|nr:glycosyltransferase family 4 protein [bacterium]
MIKILHVDLMCKEHNFKSPQEFLDKRGNSAMTKMASKMNKKGVLYNEVISLTRMKGGYFTDYDGVRFNFFEAKPKYFPNKKQFNYKMYNSKLEKYTLKFNPDIVHINQNSGNNLYRSCNYLIKNNFKYVIHFRGGNLKNFDKKRKFIFNNAVKIIVNNKSQKKEILSIFNNYDEKIEVIPLGIDLSLFHNQNLKNDVLSFGFTGRIYEHKGLLDALDFIRFVKDSYSNVKYYIAGNFETETFKREFYEKTGELGLKENIVFEGYLTGDELIKFYNKITYLLFLSRHESFGKSIVEAMACGVIPIIRKNSSGPEEIIDYGDYGYILPEKNNWEKLLLSLNNFEKRNRFIEKIKKRNLEYSFEKFYINMVYFYEDIAKK